MFRQDCLVLAAIVLIAGVQYRASVSHAADDKTGQGNEPAKPTQFDDDKFANPPPAVVSGSGGVVRKETVISTALVWPYAARESDSRQKLLAVGGGNAQSEKAVAAALAWLARHQDHDGHWSLDRFQQQCKPGDKTCTGAGDDPHDAGATAMGLLPFLAAGHTFKTKGPYQDHVRRALSWLLDHQSADGNLAHGERYMMYSHGLATIALAEAYGMTGDRQLGTAAQGAVNFILNAQNAADGGWRYMPKDRGDTSVTGWQLQALRSAQLCGLDVGKAAFVNAGKWLDSVAVHDGAEYSYQPGMASINTMTSVGLLGRQYLGVKRDHPTLVGGTKYLLSHLPDETTPNIYYWYYATQVMYNMGGADWKTWNDKMRDLLVSTQIRNADECANGSWPPEKDIWGKRGGRVMQTSLSALTLEVYYRCPPLYKRTTENGPAK